jgi:hypothetical protein
MEAIEAVRYFITPGTPGTFQIIDYLCILVPLLPVIKKSCHEKLLALISEKSMHLILKQKYKLVAKLGLYKCNLSKLLSKK